MAATNYTPISLYYSTTASAVPLNTNLVAGELALNTLDEKLYFKNSAGTVKLLASNAGASGSVTSVAASVPAFLSIAGSPITTSGTLAITYSGTALPVANGGTGQTTASAAFNALSPITTTGDLIIGNGTNSATRLAIGANGYVLTSNGTTATWSASTGGVTSFSAGSTGLTPSTGTTGAVTLAGTLAVANGGTGLTTTPANGALDIGNGTGFTRSTLTAGSGITITNGSGTITIASSGSLPSQTGNAGKYLTTDGTTASWAVISGALATPTLSPSTTTPTGGSTMTITISNYNSSYTYIIAVQAGSYTFNTSSGVISWTVPNVSSVTSYNCTVQATYSGTASVVATQTVSVQTSLITDTAIAITNFAVYSLNNGWAI
jgi:hypothetical protein